MAAAAGVGCLILAACGSGGTHQATSTTTASATAAAEPTSGSAAVAAIARELDPRYAPTALDLLKRRDPVAFDAVVAEVVESDASVAAVHQVADWLHRHRQDRIDRYLGDRKIRGRWASGKSVWTG